ncbi:MAG: hypothetical protein QGG48_04310 [Desulfatiglandales bacterium]|nr:hypothetical protein [Desulfatiglandales bacterium]
MSLVKGMASMYASLSGAKSFPAPFSFKNLAMSSRVYFSPGIGTTNAQNLSPRLRMDLAVMGIGVAGAVEKSIFQDIRIGLGAVSPTPIRARKAEDMLNGAKVGEGMIQGAGSTASDESKSIDNHRASAQYRKMMVDVLLK